jgi:hypothetical protein
LIVSTDQPPPEETGKDSAIQQTEP